MGCVCLCKSAGIKVFTSFSWAGASDSCTALHTFPGLPAFWFHEVQAVGTFRTTRTFSKGWCAERKASDKCSLRNNVSLQVEQLVKSASAGLCEQYWAGH